MAALTAGQLNDLVANTLKDLGRPNFTELATDLQEHTAFNELLNTNRIVLDSGRGVQWNVMVAHGAGAANVGLGAPDNVSIVDTMVQASADWRNTVGSYAFIGQEVDMNSGESRIVDLIKERDIACRISMAEIMESNFWGPPVASDDSVTPWGVNMWFVKNATEGFNGAAPSGYTEIGLNPTTYPRWKNWTAQYTYPTEDDLIAKWITAARFTNFKPAVTGIPQPNQGNAYGFYTTNGVLSPLERYLKANNENLGSDVAKYFNETVFMRSTVKWVPKLEADTTNPVYGIPWGWFKTYILKNWWLKQTVLPAYPGYHTVTAYFKDCTYQFITKNRRAGFVLAQGTTYPS